MKCFSFLSGYLRDLKGLLIFITVSSWHEFSSLLKDLGSTQFAEKISVCTKSNKLGRLIQEESFLTNEILFI